jgi:hypothetical protein
LGFLKRAVVVMILRRKAISENRYSGGFAFEIRCTRRGTPASARRERKAGFWKRMDTVRERVHRRDAEVAEGRRAE